MFASPDLLWLSRQAEACVSLGKRINRSEMPKNFQKYEPFLLGLREKNEREVEEGKGKGGRCVFVGCGLSGIGWQLSSQRNTQTPTPN